MEVEKLTKAFDILNSNSKLSFFRGKIKESTIKEAEQILKITLPKSYKFFLEEYGAGSFGYKEFYGITSEIEIDKGPIPNAIWYTLEQRKNFNLPNEFVVIGATDYNELMVIDVREKDEDDESPVVIWIPGFSNKTDKLTIVAKNFGEYFFNEISSVLS